MKYEIYIERKVSTYPYENLTIGYTQQFDDAETPRDAGFVEVRDKLDEWVTVEAKRVGPKSPERVLISPKQPRPRDSILDLSNEPQDRRRFR